MPTFAQRIQEADEFYDALRRPISPKTHAACSGRPLPACSGANSSTITTSIGGSRATRRTGTAAENGSMDATRTGRISTTPTSFPCRTSGNIPGMRPGISRFTVIPLALGGCDLCQGTADPDAARVVHAPERPDSRLRMGLRRCQSAGACLGSLARLQDREETQRRGRPALPGAGVSQTALEFHLVGES